MVNIEVTLMRYHASNTGTAITGYNPDVERIIVPIIDSKFETLLQEGYHVAGIELKNNYTNIY